VRLVGSWIILFLPGKSSHVNVETLHEKSKPKGPFLLMFVATEHRNVSLFTYVDPGVVLDIVNGSLKSGGIILFRLFPLDQIQEASKPLVFQVITSRSDSGSQ
jgi:hypothetical protein